MPNAVYRPDFSPLSLQFHGNEMRLKMQCSQCTEEGNLDLTGAQIMRTLLGSDLTAWLTDALIVVKYALCKPVQSALSAPSSLHPHPCPLPLTLLLLLNNAQCQSGSEIMVLLRSYNSTFPCMEALKNQRGASKTPLNGLVLYGIRELA